MLWKFRYYDTNADDNLQPLEEHRFRRELYNFVRCKSFFDHVGDLLDADNDEVISSDEWKEFFCGEGT